MKFFWKKKRNLCLLQTLSSFIDWQKMTGYKSRRKQLLVLWRCCIIALTGFNTTVLKMGFKPREVCVQTSSSVSWATMQKCIYGGYMSSPSASLDSHQESQKYTLWQNFFSLNNYQILNLNFGVKSHMKMQQLARKFKTRILKVFKNWVFAPVW